MNRAFVFTGPGLGAGVGAWVWAQAAAFTGAGLPSGYWGWVTGAGLLGLGYWGWVTGAGLLGLGYWGWVTGAGLLGLGYWGWVTGAGLLGLGVAPGPGGVRGGTGRPGHGGPARRGPGRRRSTRRSSRATKTSAPASAHRSMVSSLTPPSTCSQIEPPCAEIRARARRRFGSTRSRNRCPPKPGSTVISSSMSSSGGGAAEGHRRARVDRQPGASPGVQDLAQRTDRGPHRLDVDRHVPRAGLRGERAPSGRGLRSSGGSPPAGWCA